MPLNDPCPVCGKRHLKLPHECLAKVANLHIVVCHDYMMTKHHEKCLIPVMVEWINTSHLR